MKKILIILATICLATVFAVEGFSQDDIAPDFRLKDLTGQTVQLSKYRGVPVLLVFSTTWCPNCKTDVPKVNEIYKNYRSKGLVVFTIDIMEPFDRVLNFVRKRRVQVPVLLDGDGKVADAFGVVGVPTKVLVDPRGKIICWNCRTLEEKLKQLMP
jgi:cytochrome c biogenesis protein CcmG/thiol:disulfide interchange protein DsbE